jgi:hypothetical protein
MPVAAGAVMGVVGFVVVVAGFSDLHPLRKSRVASGSPSVVMVFILLGNGKEFVIGSRKARCFLACFSE